MKQRILIVEDEPAIADNLVYALETEGFECRWCATGGEGLRAIEQVAGAGSGAAGFDLAVLDVGLPDMGGFDLCRAIRQRCDLPILFLTARSGEIDRVVGLELGADDYVVKPFSPREVAARIKAILRRTARTPATRADALPAPAMRPGADPGAHPLPFRHDEERKRIAYFGKALELSRNEYRLLLAFLEKPGRVWSREQLMEKAWDSPESSLERTVDAHVKSLRAKLRDAKPGVEPIVTHRGLGYSLKEDW
jgi:two-component system catabolic regulation response regulator CreB